MEKIIGFLTIALLIVAGFYFMSEIKQSGYDEGFNDAWELRAGSYDKGYDAGYQACVEEYNLYLPFE